jgi:hypothetical protein
MFMLARSAGVTALSQQCLDKLSSDTKDAIQVALSRGLTLREILGLSSEPEVKELAIPVDNVVQVVFQHVLKEDTLPRRLIDLVVSTLATHLNPYVTYMYELYPRHVLTSYVYLKGALGSACDYGHYRHEESHHQSYAGSSPNQARGRPNSKCQVREFFERRRVCDIRDGSTDLEVGGYGQACVVFSHSQRGDSHVQVALLRQTWGMTRTGSLAPFQGPRHASTHFNPTLKPSCFGLEHKSH